MELDPFDERELYNKYNQTTDNTVSTTISTIVVQGGPLQLVIALLRVRTLLWSHLEIKLWMVLVSMLILGL